MVTIRPDDPELRDMFRLELHEAVFDALVEAGAITNALFDSDAARGVGRRVRQPGGPAGGDGPGDRPAAPDRPVDGHLTPLHPSRSAHAEATGHQLEAVVGLHDGHPHEAGAVGAVELARATPARRPPSARRRTSAQASPSGAGAHR